LLAEEFSVDDCAAFLLYESGSFKKQSECPDIGKVTKVYAKDNNGGANCWRHTEVLTFDRNTKLKSKVTNHLSHFASSPQTRFIADYRRTSMERK
jgi:hypothetical protein